MKKTKFTILLLAALLYCCSAFSQTTRASVASGNWSNTATWSGGVVPSSTEQPIISAGHTVTYDITSGTFAGVTINGHLTMSSSGDHTLTSNNKNIIVNGKLTMTATSWSNFQKIRFSNINESNYVGGGEVVLSTDIGLWVTDTGQLNLDGRVSGGSKTHYVNATNTINSGVSSIAINQTPSNWKSGDQVWIAPTQSPAVGDDFILGYDLKTLSANVSSASISLSSNTGYSHPKVNNTWTAEIMNLTRTIQIEGTDDDQRAHIFIKSNKVQTIRDVAFRYLGPRRDINTDGNPEKVVGRYAVHFHHCEDGARGTVVENCVVRDGGNHAFVPHGSHGITFRNNITYNTYETPYWWDIGHSTHDNLWDGNIAALAWYETGSLALPDSNTVNFAASGFEIGIGDGNVATNNIAIAIIGDPHSGGGFDWEGGNEGVWGFVGNLAHNCVGGLRVWQNTTKNHVIEDYTAYNCPVGIFHGAYANSYRYITGTLYNAPLEAKAASSHTSRVRFEDYTIDAAGLDYGVIMVSSPLSSAIPMLFRNCTITNYAIAGLIDQVGSDPHSADIIQSTGTFVVDGGAHINETLRIQPTAGQSTRVKTSGTTNISNFAPTIWGNGTGLTGEYYSNTNLTGLLFTRIDSYIGFSEWSSGIHYSITDDTYSMKWTGQVQAQFTENYTFSVHTHGGVRLWVDEELLIDEWHENNDEDYFGEIELEAGESYNIKLEYYNDDGPTGINLYWNSTGITAFSGANGEYIPQSQLFPEEGEFAKRPKDVLVKAEEAPLSEFMVPTFVKDNVIIRSPRSANYELYTLEGKLLRKGRLNAGVNYIPAGNILPGMLIMKVDNKEVFRLLKE